MYSRLILYVCGGLPKTLDETKFGVASRQGALLALKWRDNRNALVLSTKHTLAMLTIVREHHRGRIAKQKPMAVLSYNDHMQGAHL